MNRERLEELAALDALRLLQGEEKRELEKLLEEEPSARELAGDLSKTAARLPLSVEQKDPPAHLKARVLAALPDRKPAGAAPATDDEPAKAVSFRWIPWAVAACLGLVSGLLVQSNLRLRGEVASLERQGAFDTLQIAMLSSMVQGSPDARAVCVWDAESQEGVLTVEHLPPVPEGKDYQLWVVDPQYGTPVDGGVFNTAPDGKLRYRFRPGQLVRSANVFAVSLEQAGGVPVAQGPMVLASQGQ